VRKPLKAKKTLTAPPQGLSKPVTTAHGRHCRA
jgi:hypothetical protein